MKKPRKKRATAKKRANHRCKRPNPGAPSLPPNRMIPVRAIKVNKKGVVTQVVIEDKHLKKYIKQGKRK